MQSQKTTVDIIKLTAQQALEMDRPAFPAGPQAVNIILHRLGRGWEFEGKARIITRYNSFSNLCEVRFESGRVAERTVDPKAQGSKHTMLARLSTLNALNDF